MDQKDLKRLNEFFAISRAVGGDGVLGAYTLRCRSCSKGWRAPANVEALVEHGRKCSDGPPELKKLLSF